MAGKHRSPERGTTFAWDESTGTHRALAPIAVTPPWHRGQHAAPPRLDAVRALVVITAMLANVSLLPTPRRRTPVRRPAFFAKADIRG